MKGRARTSLMPASIERVHRGIAPHAPRADSLEQARLDAAAKLALARANYHLRRSLSGRSSRSKVQGSGFELKPYHPEPYTLFVGASPLTVRDIERRAKADLAAASIMRRPSGPIIERTLQALMALERAGSITGAESTAVFERLLAHRSFTHSEVKGMSTSTHLRFLHPSAISGQSDLPPELASFSDGVTDDAAYHQEIIGCGSDCRGGSVGSLPGYLFTRKNLSRPEVRRRLADHIRSMSPKVRRRVISRLQRAASIARVSGAIRSVTPSIAGNGWDAVSGPSIAIGGRRSGGCPYANVSGALTP